MKNSEGNSHMIAVDDGNCKIEQGKGQIESRKENAEISEKVKMTRVKGGGKQMNCRISMRVSPPTWAPLPPCAVILCVCTDSFIHLGIQ